MSGIFLIHHEDGNPTQFLPKCILLIVVNICLRKAMELKNRFDLFVDFLKFYIQNA